MRAYDLIMSLWTTDVESYVRMKLHQLQLLRSANDAPSDSPVTYNDVVQV